MNTVSHAQPELSAESFACVNGPRWWWWASTKKYLIAFVIIIVIVIGRLYLAPDSPHDETFICGASTTLAVKRLMMMMIVITLFSSIFDVSLLASNNGHSFVWMTLFFFPYFQRGICTEWVHRSQDCKFSEDRDQLSTGCCEVAWECTETTPTPTGFWLLKCVDWRVLATSLISASTQRVESPQTEEGYGWVV